MSGSEPKPSMPPASAFCCGVQCLFCMKEQPPERPFMVCGRCKGPMYCSKACQRAHWPQHKQHCGTMAKRIAHVEDTYGNQLVERLNRWDYDNGGGMIALARTLVGEDRIRTHALNVETAYRPVLKPHFVVVKVDVFELAMMREAQPNLYNLIQEYNAPQVERIRPNCRMAFVLLTCHNEKLLAKVVPLLYDNTVLCKPMSIEEIIHRMNNRTFNTEEIVDVPASIQAAEAVTNKLCKRLAGP